MNAPVNPSDLSDSVEIASAHPVTGGPSGGAVGGPAWMPHRSLVSRLLAVSAGFVLLAEALVFVPAMADVRDSWMAERATTAEVAVLASRIGTDNGFRRDSADELIRAAQIRSITVVENGVRNKVVGTRPAAGTRIVTVDLERQTFGASLSGALSAMVAPDGTQVRILTRPRSNAALRLDVVVEAEPLRQSLWAAASGVAATTLLLAALIGALVYASLMDGFVRPLRGLVKAITRFRDRPEDARNTIRPSGRVDEIGEAEMALADMQDALRQSLMQRERLAQLGTAVSKIAHDLRHSLGSAQLVTERLATVDDPVVRATAPRLERAISRAAGLAEASLRFGRADEPPARPEPVPLAAAVREAADEALAALPAVAFRMNTPDTSSDSQIAIADPDQLHRLLANLIRNAGQAAVRAQGETGGWVSVSLSARRRGWRIEIADNGPGLPERVRTNLFAPFNAGGVSGGTGLGLAISRDLARLNGGDVELVSTGPGGTILAVLLDEPAA